MIRLLLIAGIFMFMGCQLEEEIFDEVQGDSILDDPGAELNVIAPAYGTLNPMHSMFRDNVWGLNVLTTDELIIPCRDTRDWCDGDFGPQRLHDHSWTIISEIFDAAWNGLELSVSRCNTALFLLNDALELSPDQKAALQAEVRFLRVYYRLWQYDHYRQFPFRDELDLDFGTPPPVVKADTAFAWLEKELLDILPVLKRKGELHRSRINQDICRMMLAKLYLNAEVYTGRSRWEDALEQCEAIIAEGNYALAPDFFGLFSVNNQTGNSEAIFVIPQSEKLEFPMFSGPAWTLHYNQSLGGGFGLNGYCAGTKFFQSWDSTDMRFQDDRLSSRIGTNLGFLVGPQFNPDGSLIRTREGDSLIYTPEFSTLIGARENEGVRIMKYEPDFTSQFLLLGRADFMLFRFADLHLMKVELLYRLNQPGEALGLINELRSIRGVPILTEINEDLILRERGFELYWEGWRRQDLIRFGQFTEGSWEFKEPSEDFRRLFPIPQTALDINPNLKQTPGY